MIFPDEVFSVDDEYELASQEATGWQPQSWDTPEEKKEMSHSVAGPVVAMMRYRCHKEVSAAKITSIDTSRPVPRIYLDNGGYVDVDDAWLKEKRAQVGGYYIVYEDGYSSYSPAKAFEDGYTLIA